MDNQADLDLDNLGDHKHRTMTEGLKYRTGSIGKEKDYITREGIFRYMWMNTELTVEHKNFIYDHYPAKRDIDAVENAVVYDYSNGFVEGTNSRLKMIKRTMYGRCRKRLLEAKLRYVRKCKNG